MQRVKSKNKEHIHHEEHEDLEWVKNKNNGYIHHEGHEKKTSQNPFSGPLTLKSVGFFFVLLRVLCGANR
jgi:hypothetical protein